MKTKEHIMFDLEMPSSLESLSEADRKKLSSFQRSNSRGNIQTYEKIVPISLNDDLVIDIDDNAEKNPFDVYNDDSISEYRYPKDCDVKKKKSANGSSSNGQVSSEDSSRPSSAGSSGSSKRIRVNANPLCETVSHNLQIDTIDTDSLRDGILCLSERKRRKRAILNLSTFNAEAMVIEKILQRRKTGFEDEYEYLVKPENFEDTVWVSESVCKIKGVKAWALYQKCTDSIPSFESKEEQLIDEISKEICDCFENDGILDALIDLEKEENVNAIIQSTFMDNLLMNYSQDLSTLRNVKTSIASSKLPEKIKKHIDEKVEQFLQMSAMKSKRDPLEITKNDIALRKELVKFANYINKH
ncbi:predicted protein [Naegleria gruberi]|uniref:Predicted protein n=1 Tax=Naegleria gruberi TaxID=5762 RepID=D2V0S7_NAEGR|nr:uncharacterized protein NAEGRDRAFT_62400 [Naegleria gruberi]EFC49566.1 predicted protein [Naegleria gruberi]|eukprot:XP_002682310.1 predicted protein [Naegleria gruberi strain NEG-M]